MLKCESGQQKQNPIENFQEKGKAHFSRLLAHILGTAEITLPTKCQEVVLTAQAMVIEVGEMIIKN